MVPPVPVLMTFTTVAGTVNVTALTAPVNIAVPPMLLKANVPTPLTDVPFTSAPAMPLPVIKFKPKPAPVTAPSVISPAVVVAFVFNETVAPNVIAPKFIASSDVETPALRIAALATVNALSKLESAPENVTPVPPAVRVVVPVIAPPVVTPSTVIVPAPAAVMFNEVAVMKPNSTLSIFKPTAAVPNPTFTPALLVMLTAPAAALIAP